MQRDKLIPHLFRTEYSKIVAVLCNSFDLTHLEIAEDIAADTFLKATEVWGLKGLPENPTAWLYTVAKNKVKDYFKRNAIFEKRVKDAIKPDVAAAEKQFEFSHQNITDSQLAMIFAVCNPCNPAEAQICLALQILCGFSVEEIANAFLSKTETIKKRLHRGRTKLRTGNFKIKTLSEKEIKLRQDSVLKTLYLLFNEGYFSKTNNQVIRKDLCSEALRLAFILTQNTLTNTAETNALLSLMCFQSSRLDARIDHNGQAILFDQQDKNLWNTELIEKGNYYLAMACNGSILSKYHLEAAIAYWHATPSTSNKWQHILKLYDELILIECSHIIVLNRAFALAKVFGYAMAIKEVEKQALHHINYYHSMLGFLYADTAIDVAIGHYNQAVTLTKSTTEKQTLKKEIERLKTLVNPI